MAAVAGLLFAGCKPTKPVPPPETLLRVDWLGTTEIRSDTNAATLGRIWDLPESNLLKLQTLDKLCVAPWVLTGIEPDANASALLRPLFSDLFTAEWRFEWAAATNRPAAFALAVRMTPDRSAAWQSNLVVALKAFTDSPATPFSDRRPGWVIQQEQQPAVIGFTRSGDWTLLGAAGNLDDFDHVANRLTDPVPSASAADSATNWLAVTADLPRLGHRFAAATHVQALLPELKMNVFGRDGRTRTEAQLDFAQPLPLGLQAWDIPTHLIDQPCSSMTVCRGLPQLLGLSDIWKRLDVGPPPRQFFAWAFQGAMMQTYFLLDVPDATNMVSLATERVMNTQSNLLSSHALEGFRRSEATDGFEWWGLPYMWPFLRTMPTNGPNLVVAGMFTWFELVGPIPDNFFDQALGGGEVVYYDWERTDQRIEQWLYMSQFARLVYDKAQLTGDAAPLLWIRAVDSEVADTITTVTLTRPDQLTLDRTSDLGLTAIELHLLADWLESPTFPKGLHTFVAPPPEPPVAPE